VPTFVVYRNGREIGRIVENPKVGMLEDLSTYSLSSARPHPSRESKDLDQDGSGVPGQLPDIPMSAEPDGAGCRPMAIPLCRDAICIT